MVSQKLEITVQYKCPALINNKRMYYDAYLDHMNDVAHDVDVAVGSHWIRKLKLSVVHVKLR